MKLTKLCQGEEKQKNFNVGNKCQESNKDLEPNPFGCLHWQDVHSTSAKLYSCHKYSSPTAHSLAVIASSQVCTKMDARHLPEQVRQ